MANPYRTLYFPARRLRGPHGEVVVREQPEDAIFIEGEEVLADDVGFSSPFVLEAGSLLVIEDGAVMEVFD